MTEAIEKQRVFITMQCKGETTIFDWERHIEEVHAAIGHAMLEEDWNEMHLYGPTTGGFSAPAFCAELLMSAKQLADMMKQLHESATWLNLPIKVYVSQSTGALEWTVEGGLVASGA